MNKIITYSRGKYCQIKLDSNEKILVSIAQTGVKISKLSWGGLIPTKTIWESNDVPRMVKLFGDENEPSRDLLDSIICKCAEIKSIEEFKHYLNESS